MTPFRFRLEKIFAWRRMQLELEEIKFRQVSAAVIELDRAGAALETEARGTEFQVRDRNPLAGSDLAALDGFRQHAENEKKKIAARRAEALKKLEPQKLIMLEARRRCQLLERLKKRRLEEWEAALARELEDLAADSHLAALARRHA
jgi:hypothetical protein